ncbi:NAC domain-containing protein 54 [Linum perenne]
MPFDLPPGCRFYPSDQQLLCYYLTNKNNGDGDGYRQQQDIDRYDLIKELDLYDHEPFDLPEHSCYSYGPKGRKKHWFCYAKIRVSKEENRGSRRRAKGGYWRRFGKVRDVVGGGGNAVIIGTRTRFVFYLGNSVKSALRTDWILYEYALLDHSKASFVLCRVFVKARLGNCLSDNIVSSCAEESVSTLRHIGIQCDGISDPVQHVTLDDKNELPDHSLRQSNNPDDTTGTNGSRYEYILPTNAPVQNPGPVERNWFTNADPQELLQIIMEEDYLELDDLK